MGQIIKILIVSLCGLLLLAAASGVWVFFHFSAEGPLKKRVSVIIEKGYSINAISKTLKQASVIERPLVFRIAARFFDSNRALKAGEYSFSQSVSPKEVLQLLKSGKTIIRKITLAEGLTSTEIMDLVNNTEGLQGSILQTPKEGTLLPETYHYSFGDSRQGIIRRMQVELRHLVDSLWRKRDSGLPLLSSNEAIVLASIVERETALPDERSRIAAVFINRLKKGMRLQSDPTVIYGLTKGARTLGRRLTRGDLKSLTAYNTYIIRRLPPSPIANPGSASLKAVLHPDQTNELYFVADGKGGHFFAVSLKDHNRNVARWRKIQNSNK
jgi:UPF0755 protein